MYFDIAVIDVESYDIIAIITAFVICDYVIKHWPTINLNKFNNRYLKKILLVTRARPDVLISHGYVTCMVASPRVLIYMKTIVKLQMKADDEKNT